MISATPGNPLNIVLDTNIIISSIVFGGNPEKIIRLTLKKKFNPYISPPIINETLEVLYKKFSFSKELLNQVDKKIKSNFQVVYPLEKIHVLKDEPDNRILETAVAGNCAIIVTGDKEMLKLKKYKNIRILTASEFLKETID